MSIPSTIPSNYPWLFCTVPEKIVICVEYAGEIKPGKDWFISVVTKKKITRSYVDRAHTIYWFTKSGKHVFLEKSRFANAERHIPSRYLTLEKFNELMETLYPPIIRATAHALDDS